MPPATRLLSLLTLIEKVLMNELDPPLAGPVDRTVNFHKGLARIGLCDRGAVLLHSYTLADGQICVKAVVTWAGKQESATMSIYPGENFDWFTAAQKIAQGWIAGAQGATVAEPAQAQELAQAQHAGNVTADSIDAIIAGSA